MPFSAQKHNCFPNILKVHATLKTYIYIYIYMFLHNCLFHPSSIEQFVKTPLEILLKYEESLDNRIRDML